MKQARRKAAIDHQHQEPRGQPAARLLHHLPHPVHTGLVPPFVSLPFGLTQGRQKRQRPHPPRPGHGHQDHQRAPFEPKTLDDVLARRAYGIAVTPLGGDLAPASPLDRIVRPEHDGDPGRHQQHYNQPQQNLAGLQGRPRGPIQHPVVVGEVVLPGQAHHPQATADGPFPRRQDGSHHQHLGMQPNTVGKELRKRGQQYYHLRWQGGHRESPQTEFAVQQLLYRKGCPVSLRRQNGQSRV